MGPHDVKYQIRTEGLRSLMNGSACSFVLEGGALFLLSVVRTCDVEVEVDEVVEEVVD